MNSFVRSTLALSMLVNGLALAQLPPPAQPPYAGAATQKDKSCSTTSFSLEVPLWANGFPAGFESAFASGFYLDPRWFGLTGGLIQPRLTPVLPDYSTAYPLVRRDGHRRAFVVTFSRLQGGFPATWVGTGPVLKDYGCAVVSALRARAASVLGVSISDAWRQPPVLVSRSCDTVVQDVEGTFGPAVTSWSTTKVQALPTPGLAPIDVALIDTGVDPAWRSSMGVVSETGLPSFERVTRTEYHPHGAQMAALIRSVAPNARIRSYRALDGRGMGSLLSIARAVDDAVFDPAITSNYRKPLVINLSVGAPPFLAGATRLEGPNADGSVCTTWEDGAGETLRYVLHVAGQFELQGQQQGVFVAAAGGNSPLEFASTAYGPSVVALGTTSCSGVYSSLLGASSFIPAAFGERASCKGTTGTWLPVLPVGASTFEDRRSVVTRFRAEPRVYAPGERVYAVNPLFASSSGTVECGGTNVGFAHALESPGPVTGTSAATALTSGAAAHLMGSLYWGPASDGWNAADMARLLYLTGQPLCSSKGLPGVGRRISIERATKALDLNIAACAPLRACLSSTSHPAGAMVGSSTASVCASAMTSCFGAAATLACPAFANETGWDSYASGITPGGTCSLSWQAPPGNPPPLARRALFPDQQLSGLGPQPSGSGCPNCSFVASRYGLLLRFELSDSYEEGTQLNDAYVVILDEEKQPLEFVRVTDERTYWRPGEVGELKVLPTRLTIDEVLERVTTRSWSVVLDMAVITRDGEPARSVTPLRVEIP